jgi:tetratricopeptide (TPR) repeat protein
MDDVSLFPRHIKRREEQQILEEAALVREDRGSRAILLYGPGGVGKTSLVRQLAEANAADATTAWLEPIDIDDSEYWLLSNLEQKVANQLDPTRRYFGPYFEYLSRLPGYTRRGIEHETIVSHLSRIKRVFAECYQNFVMGSGKTVVIVFDTVETIRGMYLLLTLTQWMKALPATLFILAGRPLPGPGDEPDQIQNELEDPHQSLPVKTIWLGEFTEEAALDYLASSRVADGLSGEEQARLVRLTRGNPLWLAFTLSYLADKGLPEEAESQLDDIEQQMPYWGDTTPRGQQLQDAFKRRLVTPYRETDFWHETVKRLAVVRQRVNQPIWQQLMGDRPLPPDVANFDDAWKQLLQTPWIRPRANSRYVTLHDAVAEALAEHIIPLHDQNQQWRRELWQRAVAIYAELADNLGGTLSAEQQALFERLRLLDDSSPFGNERRIYSDEEAAVISDAAELEASKREIDQFKAIGLFYELLCDFGQGCRRFLTLFIKAKEDQDVLFQDLLALEMQRFLPGLVHPSALGDVVGRVIGQFRDWLVTANAPLYLEIGLSMADYLISNGQPVAAIEMLERLPTDNANEGQRYHLGLLQGNAYMRIPGRVKDGLAHFHRALSVAEQTAANNHKRVAEAHKELGYYHRNEGKWHEADRSYQEARNAISRTLSARSPTEDREELASIQTNWAYVKGLVGSYRDGSNLVESAITIRQRLNKHQEEAISWSVCGEVYRYERRFEKAWKAYAIAEQICQALRSWPWLGIIYQEQAICLFQANQDGVNLLPGKDSIEQAKRLITVALDVCGNQAIRSYPSALNRAGRIFGEDDIEAGLGYLDEGIDAARRLSDGWFWFANLIEYVELSYRAWQRTGHLAYRDQIAEYESRVQEAISEYEFPDLIGRWMLLCGHLAVHESLETGDENILNSALESYKKGFELIAQRYVGSSGAAAIPHEFKAFREIFSLLSPGIRAEWQEQLRRAWIDLEQGSTLLLARLEELY